MPLSALPSPRAARRAAQAIAACLALALLSPAIARADALYVAPSGDDDASGDEAAPWRTLQAAADRVQPGDRVVVRSGTYEGFQLHTSGSPSAPIEFSAEDGVVIDRENAHTDDGINLEGASHVILEGFTVEGTGRAGVRAVDCEGVTIRGVTSHDNRMWGILTGFCDDLLIEDSETAGSEVEHGIYVGNTSRDAIVADNVIWGNARNGIHLNGDAHAGGPGVITGARVEGNIIYENGWDGGSGINADGLQDSVIANNAIYDNEAAGISLYRMDGGEPSTGNLVAHNTVVMPAGARPAMQLRDGAADNEIANNLFVHEDATREAVFADDASLSGLAADYNGGTARYRVGDGGDVLDLEAWRARTGDAASSFEADPDALFSAPDAGDLRLDPAGPAAGAGSPLPEAAGGAGGVPHSACEETDVGAFACPDNAPSGGPDSPPDPGDEVDDRIGAEHAGAGGCGGGAAGAGVFIVVAGGAARGGGAARLAPSAGA